MEADVESHFPIFLFFCYIMFNPQVLETVEKILDNVLHGSMTNAVLNATERDLSDGTIYFDDFLGDGDRDNKNNTKVCIYM